MDGTVTRTTTASTTEQCATIYGCRVEDEHTSTTTANACTIRRRPRAAPEPAAETRTAGLAAAGTTKLKSRVDPDPSTLMPVIIWPRDPANVGPIIAFLQGKGLWDKTTEIGTKKIAFTAFFHVQDIPCHDFDDLFFINEASFLLVFDQVTRQCFYECAGSRSRRVDNIVSECQTDLLPFWGDRLQTG